MTSSNRAFVNSLVLYVKTGITVLVSIFYSRYLLAALGVTDYGIYNLVGGLIGMMGFITATLSNSGTRFIARSLGENNDEQTKEVFYSVLFVTKKDSLAIGCRPGNYRCNLYQFYTEYSP